MVILCGAGRPCLAQQQTKKLQQAAPRVVTRGCVLPQLHHRPGHRQALNNDRQPTAVDSLEDLEIAVPTEQRPVNELAALQQAFLYSWVSGWGITTGWQHPLAPLALASHSATLLLDPGDAPPQ
jgi:hypothetical protein